jgi:hypothetical protein
MFGRWWKGKMRALSFLPTCPYLREALEKLALLFSLHQLPVHNEVGFQETLDCPSGYCEPTSSKSFRIRQM